MFVDVVLLRSAGQKLPQAALRAATPVRGHLAVQTYRQAGHGAAPGIASDKTDAVLSDRPRDPARPLSDVQLLVLYYCRVTRIEADQLVIVGTERLGPPTGGESHPSATHG